MNVVHCVEQTSERTKKTTTIIYLALNVEWAQNGCVFAQSATVARSFGRDLDRQVKCDIGNLAKSSEQPSHFMN